MLYRLLYDGKIDSNQADEMEIGVIELAARLGYYVVTAEELLKRNCISQGKYDELLLDACSDDIVYGIEGEKEMPVD